MVIFLLKLYHNSFLQLLMQSCQAFRWQFPCSISVSKNLLLPTARPYWDMWELNPQPKSLTYLKPYPCEIVRDLPLEWFDFSVLVLANSISHICRHFRLSADHCKTNFSCLCLLCFLVLYNKTHLAMWLSYSPHFLLGSQTFLV